MSPGRSCKLGNFYPITKDDVEKLKTPLEVESEQIPPAEPEEPATGATANTEESEQNEKPETEEE